MNKSYKKFGTMKVGLVRFKETRAYKLS